MESRSNKTTKYDYSLYLIFSITGLSFCFFSGFPFANHNESYMWIPQLRDLSFTKIVTTNFDPAGYRPLGILLTWTIYKISGGGIYLQQLINWIFASSSFILLYLFSEKKLVFSFLSFFTGIFFFSGYIYLFHLHGIFYGPMQLFLVSLLLFSYKKQRLTKSSTISIVLFSTFSALFHPFSLPILGAFLTGYLIENKKESPRHKFLPFLITLIIVFILFLLFPLPEPASFNEYINRFLVTYKMTEINWAVSLVSLILAFIVLLSIKFINRKSTLTFVGFFAASISLFIIDIPVLIFWIALCLIKIVSERRFIAASLLVVTMIMPFFPSSGSPTYGIFALMISLFITAEGCADFYLNRKYLRPVTSFLILSFTVIIFLIRSGYRVPFFYSGVRPIIAEKEKSYQLQEIIVWKNNSEFSDSRLIIASPSMGPVYAKNAINRQNRPPTQQTCLDYYFGIDTLKYNYSTDRPLFVTFGGQKLKGKVLLFSVPGRDNGTAYVFY